MVAKFLAHKPASSASLTDSSIVSLSTLLIDLECKHSEHKSTFRARKVTGTFEKRTSVQINTNMTPTPFSAFKYPSYSTPLLKKNLITDQKRLALEKRVSAYADSSPDASRSSDVFQVKRSARGDGKEKRWKTTGTSCLQDGGWIYTDGGEILNLEHRPFHRAYLTGKVPCLHVQCLSLSFSSFPSPLAFRPPRAIQINWGRVSRIPTDSQCFSVSTKQ